MNSVLKGKVLRINLSTSHIWVDEPSVAFMRDYMGGALGAYYLYTLTQSGIDAFDPDNVLTFTPGFLSNLAVGAYNRLAITAKSPLTGAIIDSQAGGFWGPECKMAGFDAVVIQGRASHPVYVMIKNGESSIHDARSLWGMDTGPAEDQIKLIEGERRIHTCIIGPGGENLVRFANIANHLRHFAGRGGLGAVMGSKNLKAVAVRSSPAMAPRPLDHSRVLKLLKEINQSYAEDHSLHEILTLHGTPWGVWHNQAHGRLPTHNFQEGVFKGADRIDHNVLAKHPMSQSSENCYACRVRCKRSIDYRTDEIQIGKRYGGAEYETLGSLGSLLGIDDIVILEKANELCSRYTLDTISCGATIAWAIECFQKGLIKEDETGGFRLQWGDSQGLLEMIELIAHREGFGDLLAEGSMRAATRFGAEAEALSVQNKGMEWPAVEPRVDPPQAIAYAVNPTGADHMTTAGPDCGPEFSDLTTPLREEGLSEELVRSYLAQQIGGSMIDGFGICRFLAGPTGLSRTIDILQKATGWKTDFKELLRVGERRINLFRSYNAREGFSIERDQMPHRAFDPLRSGPEDGARIDPFEHRKAIEYYYKISNWDPESGWPNEQKLKALGLEWITDESQPKPFELTGNR